MLFEEIRVRSVLKNRKRQNLSRFFTLELVLNSSLATFTKITGIGKFVMLIFLDIDVNIGEFFLQLIKVLVISPLHLFFSQLENSVSFTIKKKIKFSDISPLAHTYSFFSTVPSCTNH